MLIFSKSCVLFTSIGAKIKTFFFLNQQVVKRKVVFWSEVDVIVFKTNLLERFYVDNLNEKHV